MKTLNRQSSFIITLLSLFLSFIALILLAPTQLGGLVTYVIVDGNSMEPDFHLGDLVLVRTEASYRAGDAVTYQNKEMGKFVFHRIIAMELDRFILKGDNNAWLDSYHPSQDEIIGKLWVHIPKLGKAIGWVRLPMNMAIATGLLGGVLMTDMIVKKTPKGVKGKNNNPGFFRGKFEGLLYVTGFLTLVFLALGIFTFTRPLTQTKDNIPYQQEGTFFYSAAGTPGVYDTDLVRTGEPIFPKLACFLNVGFTYNLLGAPVQGVSGVHQMYALVTDKRSGWQRTIPMNPQVTFNGGSYFTVASLDLCQVESLVTLMEQETSLHPNTYTLEIISHVDLSGKIGENKISDSFDPSLVFNFDKVHFYIAANDSEADSLQSTKEGLAGSSDLQPNTISILGLQFSVWSMRLISVIGFVFSLLGLGIAGMNTYRTVSNNQETLIRLKYGALLVDVYEQNIAPTSSTIDITKIDDLVKLAERQGSMILHMTQNFVHTYLVQTNGTTYRYVISTGKKGSVETEPAIQKSTPHVEVVHQEPAVVPAPIRREEKRDNKTTDIPPVQSESTQPVIIRRDADKVTKIKQVFEEPVNYVINSSRLKIARPHPTGSTEYVINTGAIEVVIPQPETMILRKIKL